MKRSMTLGIVALVAIGCSDEPAANSDKDAGVDAEQDVIIWADVGNKDSWSPIIDTNAPLQDVGAPDVAAPLDVAVDVPLPKPVTLPTDLPPDVQAIAIVSGALEGDGKTKVTKVNLPQGTVSFLAVVQGAHPGHFGLATAVTPKGDLLGKGQCQPVCTSCKNRLIASPATGAALFPNASGVAVSGGPWHFSGCGFVWKQQGNNYSTQPLPNALINAWLLARVRTSGEVPSQARLKVRLWFAGAALSAAKSFDDSRAIAMLATAVTALNSADIELAVIDRIDAPKGFADINLPEGLTTDHSSNADGLFAAAAKIGGSAVMDVFVVDSLSGASEGGQQVRGWAGGTPGPVATPGSVRGGVVIALGEFEDGATAGRQLAHELGHYLGLFNSTSHDGGSDPLDSTPICPSSADADSNGLLTAAECATHDGKNVMFWWPDATAATFTAEQARILRGNPMLWPK